MKFLHVLIYLVASVVLAINIPENKDWLTKTLLSFGLPKNYLDYLSYIQHSSIANKSLLIGLGGWLLLLLCHLFWPKKKNKFDNCKTIKDLRALKWREFEELVAYIFEKKGYNVTHNGANGGGGDGNIDVIAKKRFTKLLIQCKHYRNPIDVNEVRKILGTSIIHKGKPVIYTTSSFTKPAIEEAKKGKVILVDGESVVKELLKL